jgi:hypothetical protein
MLKFKLDQAGYDGLPDTIKEHYKAADGEDGMFTLDADGESNAAITNLKASLNKERKRADDAEGKIKDDGNTLSELEELKKKYSELEASAGKDNADVDLVKKNLQNEIDKREAKISELTGKVDSMNKQHQDDLRRTTLNSMLPENVIKSAVGDIGLHAERDLVFNEKMNDGKGGFMTQDGLGMKDWLAGKMEANQHWVKPSVPGSERGGKGGGLGDKTIKSDEFYNKPEPERRQLMSEGYKLE